LHRSWSLRSKFLKARIWTITPDTLRSRSIGVLPLRDSDLYIVQADCLSFFNSSNYSNVAILLGTTGVEFPAHRIILAHQSPFLHDVLTENPGTDLQLLSSGCSAHSYWRVFQYMYEGRYSASPTEVLKNIGMSMISNASQGTESTFQKTNQSCLNTQAWLLLHVIFEWTTWKNSLWNTSGLSYTPGQASSFSIAF